jgi:smad nuclear-interacting protein 1
MSSSRDIDISDEEAMRALLSSAESRAIEREGKQQKDALPSRQPPPPPQRDSQRRWGGEHSHNHHRHLNHKRPRLYHDNHNNHKRIQNDETTSYYGPSNDLHHKQQQRQPDTGDTVTKSNGLPRVEHDDDSILFDRTTNKKKNDDQNTNDKADTKVVPPEVKPNFGLSGALSKDMQSGNVYKGVVLKFKEPPEARAPNTQWRFYVFKQGHDTNNNHKKKNDPQEEDHLLEILHVSKQSAYLIGRNVDIADIPLYHPSISSQHAVLQYRAMPTTLNNNNPNDGKPQQQPQRRSCQPYIMDLESTNGTFLNGIRIDPARYYQLKKGDVLSFGASTREYVLLTEHTTSTTT